MKKFDWSYIPLAAVFALSMALAPVFRAQDQGSVTRITTIPEGVEYMVDGQTFTHSTSVIWPAGSKHTIAVPNPAQTAGSRTQYTFHGWQWSGGTFGQAN